MLERSACPHASVCNSQELVETHAVLVEGARAQGLPAETEIVPNLNCSGVFRHRDFNFYLLSDVHAHCGEARPVGRPNGGSGRGKAGVATTTLTKDAEGGGGPAG